MDDEVTQLLKGLNIPDSSDDSVEQDEVQKLLANIEASNDFADIDAQIADTLSGGSAFDLDSILNSTSAPSTDFTSHPKVFQPAGNIRANRFMAPSESEEEEEADEPVEEEQYNEEEEDIDRDEDYERQMREQDALLAELDGDEEQYDEEHVQDEDGEDIAHEENSQEDGEGSPREEDIDEDEETAIMNRLEEEEKREEEEKKAAEEKKRQREEEKKRVEEERRSREEEEKKKREEEERKKREEEEKKKREEEEKKERGEEEEDIEYPEALTTTKLTGPSKVGVTGRKVAARKNPVRERAARAVEEEQKRIEREKGENQGKSTQVEAQRAAAKTSQMGGYGLISAVGSDAVAMFKKAAEEKKKREETSITERGAHGSHIPEYDKNKPRLIQIKGRRNIFTRHVEMSSSSLNQGDVFLLDTAKEGIIYQWNGREANRIVKGKAMDVAKSIKDKDRSGVSRVQVLEDGVDDSNFWKFLGGKPERVPSAREGTEDAEAEKSVWGAVRLYKVIDNVNGEALDPFELQEMGNSRIYKEMLEEQFCYIIDAVAELFVWTGRKTNMKTKNGSMKLGRSILADREDNFWIAPLFRELPGAETVMFKEKFCNWGTSLPIQMQQVPVGLNTAVAQEQEKIDVMKLHTPNTNIKEEVLIDDGRGKVQAWRVEENRKIPIDTRNLGEFHSGESYLVLYSYIWKNKDCFLIYFWQGRNSSVLEKGTSAVLTMEMDDTLKGMAKEVRVVQNKEPKHFLTIFGGKLIVHLRKEKVDAPPTRMYHVHGTNDWNVHAIEVYPRTSSLTPFGCFVIYNESTFYIWKGRCCSLAEEKFAKTTVEQMSAGTRVKTEELVEGKESEAFWQVLERAQGSEGRTYPHILAGNRVQPRLFECSIGTGIFKVTEIVNFCQDDLMTEDVYLLDTVFDGVFVWIGKNSDEKEKKMSLETAVEYAEKAPAGRTIPKDKLFIAYEGREDYTFTCHFHGWDWSKYPNQQPNPTTATKVEDILKEYNRLYTYEELLNKEYPKGIDTSKLESYLTDDEFASVIGHGREEFYKLPMWHQQKIKREKKLF